MASALPVLPSPVVAMCSLIETGTASVRAACLRANAIDVLVPYIADERVVKVLHTFKDSRKGKQNLGCFLSEIGRAFCEADRVNAVLLLEILAAVPDPIECEKVTTRVVSLALAEGVDGQAITAMLTKTTSSALENMANDPATPFPDVLDERTANILLHLSKRVPRSIAQRCGAPIVEHLVKSRGGCAAALVLSIAPSVAHTSFRLDVLDCLASPELQMAVFHLIYRWVQIPHHGSHLMKTILASPSWNALRDALICRLENARVEDSPFHSVIPMILLVVMTSSWTALDNRCIQALSCFLRKRPSVFTFCCEDEPLILQRIVDIGVCLDMPPAILQNYRARLAFAKAQQSLNTRLQHAGLSEWTPPDAFQCPVTMELMRDPVVASDGFSYERASLEKIFQTTRRSPLTREILQSIAIPNINLRKRIRELPEELINIASPIKRQVSGK